MSEETETGTALVAVEKANAVQVAALEGEIKIMNEHNFSTPSDKQKGSLHYLCNGLMENYDPAGSGPAAALGAVTGGFIGIISNSAALGFGIAAASVATSISAVAINSAAKTIGNATRKQEDAIPTQAASRWKKAGEALLLAFSCSVGGVAGYLTYDHVKDESRSSQTAAPQAQQVKSSVMAIGQP